MFDPYTSSLPGRSPDPCPVCTGGPHLEEILQYEGADTVAAVILETVTGTNGIIVPPDGYLQSIREVATGAGIVLIADEVMARFGRTGRWFACRRWDVIPDIINRESMNAATCPWARWCAAMVQERIADPLFAGGPTYSGHPLACAVAVASIEAFREEGIVRRPPRAARLSPRRSGARWTASVNRELPASALLGPRAGDEPQDA